MTAAALRGLVEPGWAKALDPVADEVARLLEVARAETA